MSTVSGLGSESQLLQQIQQQLRTGGKDGVRNGPPPEAREKFQQAFASVAESLGLSASQVGDLQSQIDEAVQNIDQSGAGGKDRRSAIESAVNEVLQKNGIDPAEFKSKLDALRPQHHHGAYGPRRNQSEGADQTQTADDSTQALLKELPVGALVDATA